MERISRSPKAAALGKMLSDARTGKGMSQRELARRLGTDQSLVSRWERGERTPDALQVAGYLAVLEVTGPERDAVLEFASGDLSSSSWLAVGVPAQGVQLKALLRLEQDAEQILSWNPLIVPGLLQTRRFAWQMMLDAGVPEDEIPLRVATRLGRAEVLRPPTSLRFTALIGEGVLRQRIGGADVMAEQFDHLVTMGQMGNVDIRIVPLETGWHPGLDGGFVLIEADDTAVYLENQTSGVFLQESEGLAVYKWAAQRVLQVAHSAEHSAALIAAEAERIRR